jgi:predicted TIM-barrel fold metal-dependent hydrolase
MRDIPESVAQLEYWAKKDSNFAGSFIARSCPDGTGLDNPNLHPLFAASQDLDLPIWVHAGNGRPPWTPWPTAPNTLYHTVGGMFALTHLIGGGIFDRFPNLRIGLFSSYGGWLPYTVAKLDEVWASGSAQPPFLKRSPSEIIASGQVFLSIEPDEPQLEHAVEDLGEHLWLFGTNYPLNRRSWSWPGGLPMITQRPGLAESAKVKILGENAVRFLPRLSAGR